VRYLHLLISCAVLGLSAVRGCSRPTYLPYLPYLTILFSSSSRRCFSAAQPTLPYSHPHHWPALDSPPVHSHVVDVAIASLLVTSHCFPLVPPAPTLSPSPPPPPPDRPTRCKLHLNHDFRSGYTTNPSACTTVCRDSVQSQYPSQTHHRIAGTPQTPYETCDPSLAMATPATARRAEPDHASKSSSQDAANSTNPKLAPDQC
jgi:hypothetical protein